MRPCIIMHQYCRPMPLKERNSFGLQNLVNVTLRTEVAFHNNEICFLSVHNATPYHNTPTSRSVPLNETIKSKTCPSSSKNSNSTVMMTKVKQTHQKIEPEPTAVAPMKMPLCPLQTGCPIMCCKHLSYIGPPWPNGLPDLPEAAQHCLFADTVLLCRTCRRFKTTSKVRQHNEPGSSRVCNPRSTVSTAIWHPTCLLKTLAQPNYFVSVKPERSTDVGNVVATSKHGQCLNSLILIQSRHVQ